MWLIALLAILIAAGHVRVGAVGALVVLGLLAAKPPVQRFSQALTIVEIQSALVLGVIAFVVYPLLPATPIDPWGLVDLRTAWVAVLAVSGIGFINYVLLRLWGTRGVAYSAFLGGFVNSRAVTAELGRRVRAAPASFGATAAFGVLVANLASLLRNVLMLVLFAPGALRFGWLPLGAMIVAGGVCVVVTRPRYEEHAAIALDSPISLRHVLAFGAVFLVINVLGDIAQRTIGQIGFLAVALIGGIVSSASASTAAATLVAQGRVAPSIAADGVVLASIMTIVLNVPTLRVTSGDRELGARCRRTAVVIAGMGLAALGVVWR